MSFDKIIPVELQSGINIIEKEIVDETNKAINEIIAERNRKISVFRKEVYDTYKYFLDKLMDDNCHKFIIKGKKRSSRFLEPTLKLWYINNPEKKIVIDFIKEKGWKINIDISKYDSYYVDQQHGGPGIEYIGEDNIIITIIRK